MNPNNIFAGIGSVHVELEISKITDAELQKDLTKILNSAGSNIQEIRSLFEYIVTNVTKTPNLDMPPPSWMRVTKWGDKLKSGPVGTFDDLDELF